LEKAGNVADEALNVINQTMKAAMDFKKAVVETIANKSVGKIVDEALYNFRIGLSDRIGAGISRKGELIAAPGRSINVAKAADMTILKFTLDKLTEVSKNATFRKVDDAIDSLQAILYESKQMGAVPINSKVEGLLKQVVGELNEKLKVMGGAEYRGLNTYYSEAKRVFDKLNKALGQDVSKGVSLMKRVFSPTDGGTKKLFEQVRAITGIDLVEEATLAKLAMEIAGDARQASLLEQLNLLVKPSATNLIMAAGKKILQKLQNPEKKARDIINKASN
jgi:hypothetical protein